MKIAVATALVFSGLLMVMSLSEAVAAESSRAGPSFDCARAQSSAETLVCEDRALAALDRELARHFRLARDGKHMKQDRLAELRAYQRGWIKGRDECWKAEDLRACVRDSYAIRIHELRVGYFDSRQRDAEGISSGPLVAECRDFGAVIGLTFIEGEEPLAVLNWQRNFVVAPLTPAASGARYRGQAYDGSYEFWIKGDNAQLTPPDGARYSCLISEPG